MNVLLIGSMDNRLAGLLDEELSNYSCHRCSLNTVAETVSNLPSIQLVIMHPEPNETNAALDWILDSQTNPALEQLVTLVLAGEQLTEEDLNAFAAMGADLVTGVKIPLPALRSQVRSALKIARMQCAIAQLNTELFETSITDSLTRVLNRNGFTLRFDIQWRLSQKNNESLGLLAIDVDHFKAYNDHYGHIEADNCLLKIAQELPDLLEDTPHFIGRQGGEEFFLLIPSVERSKLIELAERLQIGIQQMRIEHKLSPSGGYVTASIGACAAHPSDTTMEKLLQTTEKALRQAKRNGRNQCCYLDAPQKVANVVYLRSS
jgi:diguanylate cyclase (GGDEF)-like protein